MAMEPSDEAKSLAENLAKYKKSIEEEFEATNPEDPDEQRKVVRRLLSKELASFVDELITLAKTATSETVQLNSLKYCIELVVGKEALGGEDELTALMNAMRKKDKV